MTRLSSAISSGVTSARIGGRPSATETSQLDIGARQPRLGDLSDTLDDRGERDGFEARGLLGVVEHRAQDARHLLNLRVDGLQTRAGAIVGAGIVANHLDIPGHQIERRAGLVGEVGGDLAQRRDPFGPSQRLARGEQLVLVGRQLRVPERQIARRLLDALVQRLIEAFELIEHLVQALGNRAELVAPGDDRPRVQVPRRRVRHGPQDQRERLSEQLADGEVDEDRHERDRGEGEPEGDAGALLSRLQQALEANRRGHRIALAARHRQRQHHDGVAAIVGGHLGGDGASRQLEHLGTLFGGGADEDVRPARLVGLEHRDGVEHRIGFDQVVQGVAKVERVERLTARRQRVGRRLRGQPRRIDQRPVDVPLERANFEIRHARRHAGHDERDKQRQPGAERQAL